MVIVLYRSKSVESAIQNNNSEEICEEKDNQVKEEIKNTMLASELKEILEKNEEKNATHTRKNRSRKNSVSKKEDIHYDYEKYKNIIVTIENDYYKGEKEVEEKTKRVKKHMKKEKNVKEEEEHVEVVEPIKEVEPVKEEVVEPVKEEEHAEEGVEPVEEEPAKEEPPKEEDDHKEDDKLLKR